MNDLAVQIEHISKKYDLGVINTGTFFRDMQTLIARKQGKPDPHAKIGDEYHDGQDSFWALKDVSLDIRQGDRVGIIGRNGAGKSTLLKLISRISAPTEGCIRINGRVASLLEVGTGFHKELTGRENIYLNGSILGMKKKIIDKKIDEIIDFSGIERHIDTPVKRYSSGMYVRLGFAVAAHLDSEILIADEVLAVGDIKFQQKAIGKMNSISSEQGRTVLFVSHNMQSVQALCNKGVILEKGRLTASGDIEDCVRKYHSVEDESNRSSWSGVEGDHNLSLLKAELIQNTNILELVITYEIHNPGLDYVFSILFYNKNNHRICFSSISDVSTDEQYEKLKSKGLHSIKLLIDSTLFATGEYHIEFDFAIHGYKRIVSPELKLFFEVFNTSNHRHSSENRLDAIEPSWKWKIIQ
ncbi:ABC transporter ATP-binding protein [Treponema zuelzerae]|uniref:ABC transporter ATP-binding protein n=1 Tax=Teretinema zuelzerae TaxID=156 RepID=A0AAE3EHT0_9SPIR|nr:ABC transporter ATP-binding protein [Teretinema zuelzerae]MCD1654646.1 ABC transporter ATP-binding protein [Teretinema zuelzerae]